MENAVYNKVLQEIDWFYSVWLEMENCISISTIIKDQTNDKIHTLEAEITDMKEIFNQMLGIKQSKSSTEQLKKIRESFDKLAKK